MELIKPSLAFIESYKSALSEFEAHDIAGFWKFFGPLGDVEEYLQKIERYQHVSGQEKGMVPASIFWLVDDDEFVGHVSVRHHLNAALERLGGHIGYAIRPSKQKQGYGSQILKLVLPRAKEIGVRQALITCDKDNIASLKIIEKNGGAFQDEVEVNGTTTLRYRIQL